ncbi:HIT family protein [Schnuerera sp. xch1]|uniref:HIT family protein n=1 Tax=Schnuerera sp. xch1 TaxID=2874283 RepID=UPI001CBD2278|nr:HIT family protein [Schnuerera sp. xch1]MBZ2174836.1 HIT family protein [Schnuerera sp. xch1]
MDCLFCNRQDLNIIAENELCFAIYDKYPVNLGHILIVPKRHYKNFFDSTEEEVTDIYKLAHKCKKILDDKYKPTGYNVGININESAGQTIMHLHVHLIPRYNNDVMDPRGGIRNLKSQLVPYKG